jgi:hypothetical protein
MNSLCGFKQNIMWLNSISKKFKDLLIISFPMIDIKQYISNQSDGNFILGRISGKVFTFSKILITLFITTGSISLIQDVFAQAEENVRIYVHIYSKPLTVE